MNLSRTLILTLAASAFAASASPAGAATFCVNAPTCPAGGVQKGDLQDAFEAAQLTLAADDVLLGDRGAPYVGPFAFPSVPVEAGNAVAIKASGPGRPVLTAGAGETVLRLGGASLQGVDIRLPSADGGVGLETGSSQIRDVRVLGPGPGDGAEGIVADGVVTLEDVEVKGTGFRGLNALAPDVEARDLRVSDVVIGVSAQDDAKLVVTRSRIVGASTALSSRGNTIVARSVLESTGPGSAGVSGSGGGLTLDHVTVAHRGPVNGNDAALEFVNVDIPGRATASAVVLAGYTRGIRRATETADPYPLAIRDSVWDPARDVLGGPQLGPFDEAGNAHVAPALVALAGGDLRPRFASAAIDRDALTDGRYTDIVGAPAADGNGDGSVLADAGALEYGRRAPAVATAKVPSSGVAGVPLAFEASGADLDGDSLRFAWAFGDGGQAAGAHATHAYALPGSYPVTLRVTDEAGLSVARSFTVTVAAAATPAGGGTVADAAPVLSSLRLSPRRARLGGIAALRLRFELSEKAAIRIVPRRIVGGRPLPARGAITRKAGAGLNSIPISRALRGLRLLRPGRLLVAVTATDTDGNRSARRIARLTLRR